MLKKPAFSGKERLSPQCLMSPKNQRMMQLIGMRLGQNFEKILPHVQSFIESVGGIFDELGIGAPSFSDFIQLIDRLANAAIGLLEGGRGVADWIAAIVEHIQTGPIGEALAGFLDKVKGFVQAVKDSLPMVAEKMGELRDKLSGIADLVVPVILDNLGGIIETIGNLWATHGEAIMASLNWVVQLGAVTGLGAVTLITGVANALLLLAEGDTPAAMDRMSTSLQTFADSAAGLVGMDWAGVVSSWETNFAMLEIIVNNWALVISPIITKAFTDGFDAVTVPAHAAGYDIGAKIRLGFEDWQAEGGLTAVFQTMLTNSVEGIAAIPGLAEALGTAVKTSLGEAWLDWHDLVDPILEGIVTGAKELGRKIVGGLAAGITSGASAVVNAIAKVIADAIAAAEKLLLAHSPSEVFAGLGENINAGLAKGIQASVQLPEQAMALAVRHTIEPASRQRMVPAAAAAAAAGATDNSRTIHLGQVNNNDGMDAAGFDLMMRDWLGA